MGTACVVGDESAIQILEEGTISRVAIGSPTFPFLDSGKMSDNDALTEYDSRYL